MKRKTLYIVLFTIAAVGLFIVQYQYLRIGLNLAQVQFERSVIKAGKEIRHDLDNENQLTFLIAKSINGNDYFSLSSDSLQDASRHFLYDYIKDRLLTQNIDTDFSYHLKSSDDSISLQAPQSFDEDASLITYPIKLEGYLPDTVQKELSLHLQFNKLTSFFLSQLHGLLIPGLVFLIIIILVVVWMFRMFYKQRNVITITNDFINNLTHELKTPVFSIGVATKLLEKEAREDQRPVIGHIRKQVNRLNVHIEQVLDLAHLESGKGFMELQQTDLRPALLQWAEEFTLLAKLEGFIFKYELAQGPYLVKCSLSHFENAVNNLLDNAKKYATDPDILLHAYMRNQQLILEIQDNGKGISDKEKRRVFNKFYRIAEGEGNLHRVKGYGLGLSYVYEVVKKHHGRIKIVSNPGNGTIVELKIPINNNE